MADEAGNPLSSSEPLHPLDLARPMPHPCESPGCTNDVEYDDEPYCFDHADAGGAYVRGYSYRRKHAQGN